MSKKEIPSIAFHTNRLIADWYGADKLKEHYSLICLRHATDNRWSNVLNTIRKAHLSEILGWTIYEDDQEHPLQWYIILVAPANRDSYVHRIQLQERDIQCNSYADPTQCPHWRIVMLRLFFNSLRKAGEGDRCYNFYGSLLIIDPTNFGTEPCEPDQLLGLTVEVTKSGCLVSHTRTFTKTDQPLTGTLAKKELYKLDAASYKLSPFLRSEIFEPGQEYYFAYNRNRNTHNIIPQFVFSDGKKLNCKVRLMNLAMNAINTRYKEYIHIRYCTIDSAPRVTYNYFNRLVETIHAELSGSTITVEDAVNEPNSQYYQQLIQTAIQNGDYYNTQASKKFKQPILTWVEPDQSSDLVIRLVPPEDKDNNASQQYLSLFQQHTHPVCQKPYQHIQVVSTKEKSIDTSIKNMLSRIMAELAIKSMIVHHRITPLSQLRFLHGWTVAISRHCDKEGNQIGGILSIGKEGELNFYMIGETLLEHQAKILSMGGELIPMSKTEIEQFFNTQRIGGKGPFFRFQQPDGPALSLIEEGEFALPNITNIDDFLHRMQTEIVCSLDEIDTALRAVGISPIPAYREQLNLPEKLTAVHIEQIVALLSSIKIDAKVRKAFRNQLPGLRRSQLKNLSNIEVMFGALTDIHYWMEGNQCCYVSTMNTNLKAITPTTNIIRLPHVRVISCPEDPRYLNSPEGQLGLERFMESLTLGFGRTGEGSVYPLPFKLLEEWMDQILLSTIGKHWSAISSRSEKETAEQTGEDKPKGNEQIS